MQTWLPMGLRYRKNVTYATIRHDTTSLFGALDFGRHQELFFCLST